MTPAQHIAEGTYNRASGVIVGTLGKVELEAAVALFARYHELRGMSEWGPIPLGDFFDRVLADEEAMRWGLNPFWRPDFTGLHERGWLVGWVPGNKESVGQLSAECIELLEHPGLYRTRRDTAKGVSRG